MPTESQCTKNKQLLIQVEMPVSTKSLSLSKRLRNSGSSQNAQMFKTSWSTRWRLQFGNAMMLRKASFASFSVACPRSSPNLAVADSEVKLMSFYVVILPLQNLSFCSMCIRLHLVVSTHLVKVAQLSVLLSISPETLKLKNQYSKVVPWSFQIVAYAALMNLTRWTIILARFFTKLWSNRQFRSPRLASFAL